MSMRLGLFGGSFDPVHLGHLLLAETCREAASLDQVWFVPAARSPHKLGQSVTRSQPRVEMLRLAISGHDGFDLCDIEIERGGVSYWVDTLQAIHDREPQAELFFLMGADTLADFSTWRDPARICQLAVPLIARRPSSPPLDMTALVPLVSPDRFDQICQFKIEMPLIELSSRDLRDRIQEGRSIRYRTPRSVEKYIQTQRLYVGGNR